MGPVRALRPYQPTSLQTQGVEILSPLETLPPADVADAARTVLVGTLREHARRAPDDRLSELESGVKLALAYGASPGAFASSPLARQAQRFSSLPIAVASNHQLLDEATTLIRTLTPVIIDTPDWAPRRPYQITPIAENSRADIALLAPEIAYVNSVVAFCLATDWVEIAVPSDARPQVRQLRRDVFGVAKAMQWELELAGLLDRPRPDLAHITAMVARGREGCPDERNSHMAALFAGESLNGHFAGFGDKWSLQEILDVLNVGNQLDAQFGRWSDLDLFEFRADVTAFAGILYETGGTESQIYDLLGRLFAASLGPWEDFNQEAFQAAYPERAHELSYEHFYGPAGVLCWMIEARIWEMTAFDEIVPIIEDRIRFSHQLLGYSQGIQ